MNTETVNGIQFTRLKHDTNGNPRYVCHFVNLLKDGEKGYENALHNARSIGGKKFHNKQYGGGIVFQSYNLRELADSIQQIVKKIS